MPPGVPWICGETLAGSLNATVPGEVMTQCRARPDRSTQQCPSSPPAWASCRFAIAPHYGRQPGSAGATGVTDYYIDNHIPFVALRDGHAIVVDGQRIMVVE